MSTTEKKDYCPLYRSVADIFNEMVSRGEKDEALELMSWYMSYGLDGVQLPVTNKEVHYALMLIKNRLDNANDKFNKAKTCIQPTNREVKNRVSLDSIPDKTDDTFHKILDYCRNKEGWIERIKTNENLGDIKSELYQLFDNKDGVINVLKFVRDKYNYSTK